MGEAQKGCQRAKNTPTEKLPYRGCDCKLSECRINITKNASGLLHSGAFLFVETSISADAMLFMLFS